MGSSGKSKLNFLIRINTNFLLAIFVACFVVRSALWDIQMPTHVFMHILIGLKNTWNNEIM